MSKIMPGPWSIKDCKKEKYPEGYHCNVEEINFETVAPGNERVNFSRFASPSSFRGKNAAYEVWCGKKGSVYKRVFRIPRGGRKFAVEGLQNGRDYCFRLIARNSENAVIIGKSPVRLARPGIIPGRVINYIHPEDLTYSFSGCYPCSPSIARLPRGGYIASHDIYRPNGGQNLTKIFKSCDSGLEWEFLTDLYPCFWGKLFVHRGFLYMLGTSTEYGDLLIGRSEDGGITWSPPTIIMEGGGTREGGPHKAPVPVVESHGRIWSGVEFGSWDLGGHSAGAVSAPSDCDFLDPENWTVSEFLGYDSSWPGAVKGGSPSMLEGNVARTPEGGLAIIMRYQTDSSTPFYGKAVMLDIQPSDPRKAPSFRKIIDFPGNLSKFTINRDPGAGHYWTLVNRVTGKSCCRNILSLACSPDLFEWTIVRDVLNYQDNDWPEGSGKTAFQYPDFLFDGDDIIAVSRTAINGANNWHDANFLTFHRIQNFRSLF